MFKKLAVLLVLVLSLCMPLVGCGGSGETEGSGETASQEESKSDDTLVVVGDIDSHMDDFGDPVCKGIIQNNSGKDLGYVEINFTFYNEEGNQIGTAWTNTTDLKKDSKWEFEAIGTTTDQQKPAEYEYTINYDAY